MLKQPIDTFFTIELLVTIGNAYFGIFMAQHDRCHTQDHNHRKGNAESHSHGQQPAPLSMRKPLEAEPKAVSIWSGKEHL
jgi:hypothetical protein